MWSFSLNFLGAKTNSVYENWSANIMVDFLFLVGNMEKIYASKIFYMRVLHNFFFLFGYILGQENTVTVTLLPCFMSSLWSFTCMELILSKSSYCAIRIIRLNDWDILLFLLFLCLFFSFICMLFNPNLIILFSFIHQNWREWLGLKTPSRYVNHFSI